MEFDFGSSVTFDVQLIQTHAFDMCHYYDKSNVTIMMSLEQLHTSQEEGCANIIPSKYCVIFYVFTN